MRRALLSQRAVAAAIVASLTAIAMTVAATPAGARIRAVRVAGGLNTPTAFAFGTGDRIWFVEKNTGEVRILNVDSGHDRRFFAISRVNGDGERGALGIALHPDFPSKPWVYVYVTRRSDGRLRNQIVRIRERDGRGRGLRTIWSSPASGSSIHNGGRIAFGPDGMLYAVVGEGGSPGRSQQLGNEQGDILRMTPGGGVPGDNPLGSRRIFAYGIRNSFGFAFDPQTGDLWETENGPECNDELNHILPGENYGWGPNETCSGGAPQNTNQDGPSPHLPEAFYGSTLGVTGMAFCESCGLGAKSEDRLFFGAVNNGQIRRVKLTDSRNGVTAQRVVYDHDDGVLSIEAASNGTIFLSDFGAIYKLVRR